MNEDGIADSNLEADESFQETEGRRFQVFVSDLADEETLERVLPSPWRDGPDARIPLEHWEALGQVALDRGYVDMVLWEKMSDLDGAEFSLQEEELFRECLLRLQAFLRTDLMLMLQRTADCPEPLPGTEHARMLEAVIQVLDISAHEMDSYTESAMKA